MVSNCPKGRRGSENDQDLGSAGAELEESVHGERIRECGLEFLWDLLGGKAKARE